MKSLIRLTRLPAPRGWILCTASLSLKWGFCVSTPPAKSCSARPLADRQWRRIFCNRHLSQTSGIAPSGLEYRLPNTRPLFAGLICLTLGALATPAWADRFCNTPFAEFVTKFQEQPALQPGLTADPMPMSSFTSMGSTMPRRDIIDVAHADLDWPFLPSTTALKAQGLVVNLREVDAETAELIAATEDDNTLLIWHFSKAPCWRLVSFTDTTIHQ